MLVSYRPLGVYPPTKPTYADAHAGAISEVRISGYEFGHTYVWQGPDTACAGTSIMIGGCISSKPDSDVELQPKSGFDQREPQAPAHAVYATTHYQTSRSRSAPEKSVGPLSTGDEAKHGPFGPLGWCIPS